MTADEGSGEEADDQIGVVVVTMNRCDELSRTLSKIEQLAEVSKVVVVDNGSSDGTAVMVRTEHPNVDLISLPRNIGAAARNIGVRHLATPFVAFLDDDTWPEPGALSVASRVLSSHPQVAIVTGHILIGTDGADDPTCVLMSKSPIATPASLPGRAVIGFVAGASVVRKDPFIGAGGFARRAGIGGEEELLAYDLLDDGWMILYVPEMVIRHYPSPCRDHRARARVVARNRMRVAWMRRPWSKAIHITIGEYRNRDRFEPALPLRDLALLIPALTRRRRLGDSAERLVGQVEGHGLARLLVGGEG
ncbi:MAG TPA: glycosyltransferase [Ilumatobacter sp.]|nr:glycosyltransferase [Ilumatobacter sp.]